MICIAKTGSGKTCGFLLPSFHQHIQSKKNTRGPILLVLAPTRELACQIMEETQKFGRPLGMRSICCFGGSPKYAQIQALDRGVECCIATPGRLNDLLEMKKANLSNVKYVVVRILKHDVHSTPVVSKILTIVHLPRSTSSMRLTGW